MVEGVHASVTAIETMEEACGRFARAVLERLPDIQSDLRRVTQALEEREDELRGEIFRLEDAISSADDDEDTSWERNRLSEAEEELASVQRRQRKVAEAGSVLDAQTKKIEYLSTEHTIKAQEFLRGAAEDLKAYFEKDLGGNSGIVGLAAKKCTSPASILTTAEKQALLKYTDKEFDLINKALRQSSTDEVALRRAALVSKALSKLPSYKGKVYRGTTLDQKAINRYVPNTIVTELPFTSSSRVKDKAFKGNVRFTLLSKTAKDISDFSTHATELETLFDQRTQFKVVSRESVDGILNIELHEL